MPTLASPLESFLAARRSRQVRARRAWVALLTGLAFWSPYLYWLAAIMGGGPTARFIHPWFGLIFAASLFWTFK